MTETTNLSIQDKVKSFLYCYYLCDKPYENSITKKTLDTVFSNLSDIELNLPEMIEQAHRLFMDAVQIEPNTHNVLPLSGGYDSRAILCGLLEQKSAKDISIVSYGTEGTYDYEIVKQLNKNLDLNVSFIDINQEPITQQGLIETAKNGAHWTFLFDAYFRQPMYKKYGKSATFWSGYLAGEVAGSHVFKEKSKTWEEALNRFISWNYYTKGQDILPNDFSPFNILPRQPLLANDRIALHDQVDFYIRQCNYVERIVVGNGYDHRIPFLDEALMRFYFSIPHEYRYKRKLYRKWLGSKFKDTFSLPTQSDFGAGINRSNFTFRTRQVLNKVRNTVNLPLPTSIWESMKIYESRNYIDFRKELEKPAFQQLAHNTINELEERKIIDWVSPLKIWKNHKSKKKDYTRAILLFIALEIHLKVEETLS